MDYALNEAGMKNAKKVIVGGFSSGGQTVYYWINIVGDAVRKTSPDAKIFGYTDGGIFLDRKDIYTNKYHYI